MVRFLVNKDSRNFLSDKHRKKIVAAVDLAAKELGLKNYSGNHTARIVFTDKIDTKPQIKGGTVVGEYDPNTMTIYVLVKRWTFGALLRTLFHEMEHLRQDISGDLGQKYYKVGANYLPHLTWMGKVIPRDMAYLDLPHEKAARKAEWRIYFKWLKYRLFSLNK